MNLIQQNLFLAPLLLIFSSCFSPLQADVPKNLATEDFIVRVEKRGDAVFFLKRTAIISRSWTVSCRVALGGCSAKNGPLRLRLDSGSRVWLSVMTPIESRISIQVKNVAYDTPGLFSRPLKDDHIRLLSKTGASLNVEQAFDDSLNASTAGLDLVVRYLKWVRDPEIRFKNDAREWQPNKQQANESENVSVLEHHGMQNLSDQAPNRRIVPYTKPQVEFAIRAQTNHETNN